MGRYIILIPLFFFQFAVQCHHVVVTHQGASKISSAEPIVRLIFASARMSDVFRVAQ